MTLEVNPDSETAAAPPVLISSWLRESVARAAGQGVSVTGEGGLLQQLIKLVLEASLEGEMDAYLGHSKHDPAGRNGSQVSPITRQAKPAALSAPMPGAT